MTIQDLGSLGELIAAIATVATLAYLALQIRQNTKSIRGSTAQSLMSLDVNTYALLAQHASIYRRGNSSIAELDADEKAVFELLVSAVISQTFSAFAQYQGGLIPESYWATYIFEWENYYLNQPGFQSVWAEIRKTYPEEFRQCLGEIDKTADGAA